MLYEMDVADPASKTEDVQHAEHADPWEYCEVVHRGAASKRKHRTLFDALARHRYYDITFVGLTVGPRGGRVASPEFSGGVQAWPDRALLNDGNRAAVNDLIRHLFSTGWEPLPRKGTQWYSLRFRRRA